MHRTWLFANRRPVADLGSASLKILEIGARRDLSVLALPREPDFEIVGLCGRKAEVASAQRRDPIVEAKSAQHLLGIGAQPLELTVRFFGRAKLYQLDLIELVLADHAARIAPVAASLGAEARAVRRVLHREAL